MTGSKSKFDFSNTASENAKRLGIDPVDLPVDDLVFSKRSLDEQLVARYAVLDTEPPPVIVMNSNGCLKIVDGHHRVEAAKRMGRITIKAYLS